MLKISTIGSVCSGIEAASVAWEPFDVTVEWLSEIAEFPSKILKHKYPYINNLGDMNDIPDQIKNELIEAPDLICGGTPCQAFSLAGFKNGLNDERANLTLKFAEIIEANDIVRGKKNQPSTIVFWENVEGVLSDKTNVFGKFVSTLAGLNTPIQYDNWASSGILYGIKRNIAWRVLDAKYFGVPQQRRRLYLLAGGKDFYPENVLFEKHINPLREFPHSPLTFQKEGHYFEIFREYTDCLYAAYGTKWNGNAAAFNGSLFVVQDGKLRRLSPVETERLMGFPDNYTFLPNAKKTNRYQATGNSWVIPVIRWIGARLFTEYKAELQDTFSNLLTDDKLCDKVGGALYVPLGKNVRYLEDGSSINCTEIPENPIFGKMEEIISSDVPKDIYISPVGCYGIIRRKGERRLPMNDRLEKILLSISAQMSMEEIERRSRIQKRGQCYEY